MKRRPKFGQNFLVDPYWQTRIVNAFEPPGAFAEIGPGKGALTQHLEKKFKDFVVFEIDPEMLSFHKSKNYRVYRMDFLDWDFQLEGKPLENFSFIGNLPYESGTAMLLKILEHVPQVVHFVFMLQREVVDRICAREGSRDFGALSVLMQGQYKIEQIGIVKPGSFRPSPKVDSAVIKVWRRNDTHPQTQDYRNFVFRAFQFKRKTLRNALRGEVDMERLKDLYAEMQWPEAKRAEEIPVEIWPKIYERLMLHE